MSKSVLSVILYNGNKSDDSREKSTSKDLVNLLKSSNVKLNLLYDLNDTNVISAYGIRGKVLSHLQKCYSHISLKFLPYLSQTNSRNVRLQHRFDKYPCKDHFHFFAKPYNLKKHTRNTPTQKRIGYIKHKMRNDYLYMNNKSKKKIKELDSHANNKEEINSKMASYHNSVSQSNINSHCVYTFDKMHDHPVITTTFPKIKIQEILPLDNVADLLANLNLNQAIIENNTAPVSIITKFKENCDNTHNNELSSFDNINTLRKPMMAELCHNFYIGHVDKNTQLSSYNSMNTNCSNAQCKIDFCSGDDSRNSNLKYVINNISDTKELVQAQSEGVSSKTRSVQWSTEVNVIYYAGDINGDKEIWRKVEPLHEEVCQQTWPNNLVQINLTNKNISSMNNYQSFGS